MHRIRTDPLSGRSDKTAGLESSKGENSDPDSSVLLVLLRCNSGDEMSLLSGRTSFISHISVILTLTRINYLSYSGLSMPVLICNDLPCSGVMRGPSLSLSVVLARVRLADKCVYKIHIRGKSTNYLRSMENQLTTSKVSGTDEKRSSMDKSSTVSEENCADGIHDGLQFPTEEERDTLRRVPDSLPWSAYRELSLPHSSASPSLLAYQSLRSLS